MLIFFEFLSANYKMTIILAHFIAVLCWLVDQRIAYVSFMLVDDYKTHKEFPVGLDPV